MTKIGVVLGFEFGSWNSNIKLNLSTATLPGQTTKKALAEEFMFPNVAYRPKVYITGGPTRNKYVINFELRSHLVGNVVQFT